MKYPDVSVIIPTYNRISMLEEALQSVFAQEFDGLVETLVIDDNSEDGTSKIVSRKYPEVNLISLKQNVGAAAARNRALSIAQGRYIAFLDSDDLWEKDYLKTQISALEGKKKCFSVSNILVWNTVKNKKQIQILKPDLEKYTSPLHHLMVGNFIYIPSCVVFPRQVLEEVGLFDERIKRGEDADFYARCLIANYTPIFTNQPLAIQRKHDQGQSTDIKNQEERIKNRLLIIQKNYPIIQKKGCLNVSQNRLYGDVYKKYAQLYLKQKNIGQWLRCSKKLADCTSWGYALSNMKNDLQDRIRSKLAFSRL
ncbi:glycosyltransferase family 2 protein [Limnoraphis robusta Tam1]|uniref:Glycosyltransferase family 2 protein n=1 Tax=Limnoraphis robusta CCNP1315 TaxID=3110306 RepID=A0ABU5TUK3_9CYAN|nr:glycosyltransferase family 2 protein [Limnoraphis robusta]MEA5499841.1 glycosyltransferase family 2 protein [Limnoraphis robusta BA-68 BA1]MEA5518581.1 glycosyltransferase family 2 protein [Limnoraphis robusta CCNP1315]MEA5538689.1 glycosyltransferase family 2 protein [Limnoraphis robusta Tam1]MEA5548024.1 glycosyltransferase family 2 protein [Limnoraphis robusta CCNP1324]